MVLVLALACLWGGAPGVSSGTPPAGPEGFGTAPPAAWATPLAGSYAVGAGGDFATPAEAVAALSAQGVAGPVTFTVAEGVYEGALALGGVTGASAADTVRFVASGTVELVAGAPAVIHLNGARHVRFEGFLVRLDVASDANGHALHLEGSLQDVVFRENHFVRPPASSSNRNEVVYANFSGSAPHFIGNTFEGGRGVHLDGNSTQCGGACPGLVFEANAVAGHLYVASLRAPRIERNRIRGPFTGQSLRGTADAPPVIVNNAVRSTGRTLLLGSSEHVRLYHNTFVGGCLSTSSFEGNVSIAHTNGVHIVGNAFVCATAGDGFAPGLALHVHTSTSTVAVSDHNAFHTPGPFVAALTGTPYRSLDDLRASAAWAGKDANSVEGFVSLDETLRTDAPWLARAGMPLAEVENDIDGNPRSPTAPSIGAYEFTSSRTLLPAGSYTVGAGGDYATMAAVFDDLAIRGAAGAVTIAVSGVHPGPVTLESAHGIGPDAPLTLTSASGDAPAVLVAPEAGATLLHLRGTRHVRLHGLTLDATARTEDAFRTIHIGAGVYDAEVRGVTFLGPDMPGGLPAALYTDGLHVAHLRVEESRFVGGGFAVNVRGGGAFPRAEGFVFARNEVNGARRGLLLHSLGAPRIEANRMTVQAHGINCQGCDGIGEGEDAVDGLIANNAIRAQSAEAVWLYGTRQQVFHNTLSVGTCPSTLTGALYLHGSTSATGYAVRNNVIACETGGRVFSHVQGHTLSSDHNHFYSPGAAPFGTNAQAWGSLADFQMATGLDPHSAFGEVTFTDVDDLRLAAVAADAFRGTPLTLALVPTDLLAEPRASPPRQGAYEAAGPAVSAEPTLPTGEPLAFALAPNYPNPFRGRSAVRFALPEPAHVVLTVVDLMGREVARVVDAPLPAGWHEAVLEAQALASGTYVLRLDAGAHRATRRLTIVR